MSLFARVSQDSSLSPPSPHMKQVTVFGGTRNSSQIQEGLRLLTSNTLRLEAAAANTMTEPLQEIPSGPCVYKDVSIRLSSQQEGPLAVRFFENICSRLDETSFRKWIARQTLLKLVSETNDIYRMSLVPTDPNELQTWFMARSVIDQEPPRGLESKVARTLEVSFRQDDITHKIAHGMVCPWNNFSSNLVTPEYTYEQTLLLRQIEKIEIKTEDTSTLKLVESIDLNDRLQRIAHFFFLDANTHSLLLTVGDLFQRRARTLLFQRPQAVQIKEIFLTHS